MHQAGPNPPAAHDAYSFAGFILDLERETLLRGAEEVRLRPKSYEMLRCLAEHAETLVTKDHMLETVWPDSVVTDSSLSQCLAEIRRALGDHDKTLVRTVPRRGVILDTPVIRQAAGSTTSAREPAVNAVAESRGIPDPSAGAAGVAEAGPDGVPGSIPATPREPARPGQTVAASRRRMLFPFILIAFGLAMWWALPDRTGDSAGTSSAAGPGMRPLSIAVLPFEDLSEDSNQEWFGDGMAEEIINLLVRADDLQVIARTSSFSFKDRPGATIETIARALNVAYLLEGSVRRVGDRVRVTAQLIDTADSTHVWSQAYDQSLGDLLGTQIDIAGAVADALQVELRPNTGSAWARPVAPRSYRRFLEGRHFYHRRAPGDLEQARECFEDAVAMDPENAAAWTYLAGVYRLKIFSRELTLEEGLPAMREAIENALELAPKDAEAQARAGLLASLAGDREGAMRHIYRARELDPDNWLVLGAFAGQAFSNLEFETALRLQRRAAALDPLSPLVRGNLAGFLLAAGLYDEAEAEAVAVADLSPPTAGRMAVLRAEALLLRNRPGDALEVLETWPAGRSGGLTESGARWISARAMALDALGRTREARAEIDPLAEDPSPAARTAQARFYGYTGQPDRAFAALDALAAWGAKGGQGGAFMGVNLNPLRASPFLRSLHSDPRWARFMDATRYY